MNDHAYGLRLRLEDSDRGRDRFGLGWLKSFRCRDDRGRAEQRSPDNDERRD
jgi:hypothetical protein